MNLSLKLLLKQRNALCCSYNFSKRHFKIPKFPPTFGDASNSKREHYETVKIGYSAEQMYRLAADVVHYKDFVPWCTDSKVIRHVSTNCAEVELSVGFPPLVEKYTSLVTFSKPKMVKSVSQESRLFNYLMSTWQFHPNADDPETCIVHFSVIFEFRSPLYASLTNLVFEEVTANMINAFFKRARDVYGPPKFGHKSNINE
ncbi:Coenzyme Q-binding protein COQ10 -like protein A, mitochondrial [Trichinella pseudospiralis]|uniref:Coenzyme Q-binding protein COQ10-like protein A, mitochondrial n=2 Tax=Trichinella pseudospiralis TaxID=6337 RepID=A0A0V1JE14_TRIPS|nr:Coenzyme Q-binding protein COQ10 -like protein A, mitochondrial [Trichinella pseudospiralis]KRY80049.1 Coenzyme Q-binding protein COQ10 -like protein A, mitochondrial [Trichinella pseudospiralis]KRY88049.1 Coenzyme Q-binding protein COQ10 -like protein A, mitochondrial [Trichinella pseudospiralis]KRZ33210.1 Coenzyme Q-binding protein COQ10 -like protein A, mitochondrial [Trichinella pseudospiralis]KRZ39596.1 Coenzyme Q-binding protein COQ10 -like protein A, mitochondrial [Trichinella pseudos